MTADDHDVLQALAAADAASPPPPGVGWSGAALRAAAVRSTRRKLAIAAGVLALGAFAAAVAPRCARGDNDGERERAELRADLETLRAWLAVRPAPMPFSRDDDEHWLAAAADLRYELANARAAAVLAATRTPGKNR